MTAFQNQMVCSTALRRAAAIDFPRVLAGVFGQGFVTRRLGQESVRACPIAGCAGPDIRGFAAGKRGGAKRGRRTRTRASDVVVRDLMTAVPIRRSGGRLIGTGQLDLVTSRGRRLAGADLCGRAPAPLCGPSVLDRSPAHVAFQDPVLDRAGKPAPAAIKRPLPLSEHARTLFRRSA